MKEPDREIEVQFRRVDRDSNGMIDFAEFCLMLKALGFNRSTAVKQHAFSQIDRDKNAQIDLKEFSQWWNNPALSGAEIEATRAKDFPEP